MIFNFDSVGSVWVKWYGVMLILSVACIHSLLDVGADPVDGFLAR